MPIMHGSVLSHILWFYYSWTLLSPSS